MAVGYGAIWVATALDGEVVRVDLETGRVTKRVAVGGHPVALATGADGVWVASEESGTVARIDPGTGEAVDAIAVGNGPTAVAVGLGAVWTANREDGTVSRIDPTASHVTNTVPAGHEPTALAIGEDALWVADAEGALLRLDAETDEVDALVDIDSAPTGVVDFDDAIWVTTVAPPTAHRGGTLRVGVAPTPLDPALGTYVLDSFLVHGLAYESLVGYRRVGGTAGAGLVGDLATDVPSPVEGGRRYIFQLRDDVRCSDGSPLRAADVRASVERTIVLSPEVGALLFDSVVGANRCLGAGPRCNLSAGIVTNEQAGTVTINLRRPDPQLLEKLAILRVTPADTPRTPLRTHPPPSTGPYRIEQIIPDRRALLTRNPYFEPAERERPAGFADRVEVEMGDERDQAEDVERGRLDVATVYAPATGATAALRTRLGARLRSGPFAMTEYAWLNTSAPPFDDQRVRQALNLAVDRGRIVDLTGGTESADPTCQLLPPGLPGYRPVCSFTLAPSPAGAWKGADRARAQALIAQSGARGTPIEVWAWPARASVGRYLAEVLNGLGFPARVRVFKGRGTEGLGESIEAVGRPGERPQIGLNGWIADSPDSATFLRALIGCEEEFNLSSFCDPKIDTAIAQAEAAGAEGSSAWQRIERQVAQRAPVVPLTTRRYVVVTSSRAGDVQFNPINGVLFDQIWVE